MCAHYGAPQIVHADSGPAMRSNLLRDALTSRGVALSHNRPNVSNDNPLSESGFKTMKYRPDYPRVFEGLQTARVYLADYVPWYNTQHKHSGIALFSPAEVHDASWKELWKNAITPYSATTTGTPNDSTTDPSHQPPPDRHHPPDNKDTLAVSNVSTARWSASRSSTRQVTICRE